MISSYIKVISEYVIWCLKMGKKGVFSRVDEALLLEFKEYLLRKYGKLDGVFSRELENAIRFYPLKP